MNDRVWERFYAALCTGADYRTNFEELAKRADKMLEEYRKRRYEHMALDEKDNEDE